MPQQTSASPGALESSGAGCSGRIWQFEPTDEAAVQQIASSFAAPPVIARLLVQAGCTSAAAAERFLAPSVEQLHDPNLLAGMQAAVERIVQAVRHAEPILIYGDYDVDGTLATVLLKTAIDRITPKGMPTLVRYHIPHRIREGYGMQAGVLSSAAAAGVRLVISVDTGIRAFAAAQEAQALGLHLIVTDHHLPEGIDLPAAVAVVNPNQPGCSYPEKQLCGAAVAWKLAETLLHAADSMPGLQPVDAPAFQKLRLSLLKLAAIATVADAVPLTGENRAIVSLGLAELREVRQPGLRALMRLARVGEAGRAPLASEIAFRIGPRINAAGRMDVASDVVRLLLTRETAEAELLAERLHSLNDERRSVEAAVLQDIQDHIDALIAAAEEGSPDVFVLDGEGWHRGVIGILASRAVEHTHRPALVITHEDGVAHGSGRSVEGFHLLDAVTDAHRRHRMETSEDLFLRFGGHAHAIGFSLPSQHVPILRRRMLASAAERRVALPASPSTRVQAELPVQQADHSLWQWLCRLQPFGNGNEEPVFFAGNLRIVQIRAIKERHLKLCVQPDAGPEVECLCWARSFHWPERLTACGIETGSRIDVLYQVRWNDRPEYRGIELHICDLRLTHPAA